MKVCAWGLAALGITSVSGCSAQRSAAKESNDEAAVGIDLKRDGPVMVVMYGGPPMRYRPAADPMVVVDGEAFKGSLKDVDPATIDSLNVLKGGQAVEKYGEDAEAGVVEVTLKKPEK